MLLPEQDGVREPKVVRVGKTLCVLQTTLTMCVAERAVIPRIEAAMVYICHI